MSRQGLDVALKAVIFELLRGLWGDIPSDFRRATPVEAVFAMEVILEGARLKRIYDGQERR
jgi:hypothetical protein